MLYKKVAIPIMLAGVFAMTSPTASASEIEVAGGKLDRSIPGMDVYKGVPKAAEAPPTKACQAVQRYVELVNSGRYREVASLFEEKAVVLEPSGGERMGREAIDEFYSRFIGQMHPDVVAVAYTGDDVDCMVELAAEMKIEGQMRYVLISVDHFTLGDSGRFSRMVGFVRLPKSSVEDAKARMLESE